MRESILTKVYSRCSLNFKRTIVAHVMSAIASTAWLPVLLAQLRFAKRCAQHSMPNTTKDLL